ncbi:MAG: ThiF family adenylyltransferase [Deltaproteobacteria bacterium]|nr:ThiF family adenylyltransferase [Deltaproteobacteria bacterium]
MPLSDAEVERYARQLLLPGWGKVPQDFVRVSRVQVVGGGPVAGPALAYLAAAGVGTILVDDAADAAAEDAAGWLWPPDRVGQPRSSVALESLRGANRFAKVRLHATGADPTAALVCASGATAREAAERARTAGIPHVVAEGDGDGGSVVVVPPGAPCFACAFRVGTGIPPPPATAAALGALAAAELLMILSGASLPMEGRRIELVRGHPQSRPTTRQPGCACGAPRVV